MKKLIRNNNGSALIFVIACLAIMSAVGTMLLVRTTNNREMKERERVANETFYKAETGSVEFAAALESVCETAVKNAFADLMVEYKKVSDDDRNQRFANVFYKELENNLKTSDTMKLLRNALGKASDDDISVKVSYKESDYMIDPAYSGDSNNVGIILKNVEFTYTDSKGNNSKIKTDIKLTTKVPNVEEGMVSGPCAEFYDFALISGGTVSVPNGGGSDKKINGNVFVEQDLVMNTATTKALEITNAQKLLIKRDILLSNGSLLKISCTTANQLGAGLWARNLNVAKGSKFESSNTNVYLRDDLVLSGTGTNVKMTGSSNEYIGYSYNPQKAIENDQAESLYNSAITINGSQNVTLDLSGLDMLVLRGNSYIYDYNAFERTKAADDTSKLVGILQGESLAYKDLQAMYLVPSECTPLKQNPCSATAFNAKVTNATLNAEDIEAILDFDIADVYDHVSYKLRNYLNEEKPYVTRYVRLDGGGTEYVYLYLNFKGVNEARQFHTDYLNTTRGARIKELAKNLKSSNIKLPSKVYTLSDTFTYLTNEETNASTFSLGNFDSSGLVRMSNRSLTANRNYSGLFSFFKLDYSTVLPDDYDVIAKAVLRKKDLQEIVQAAKETATDPSYFKPDNTLMENRTITANGESCILQVYKGDITSAILNNNGADNKKGIILVQGNINFDNGFTFSGLVLATGNVKINNVNLSANNDLVVAMLENEEVAKYFKGQGASGNNTNGYLSNKATKITFENWTKN